LVLWCFGSLVLWCLPRRRSVWAGDADMAPFMPGVKTPCK
jgi:hypothetical protein